MSILYDRAAVGHLQVGVTAAARTAVVLDSNFTLGTAGDCIGLRFIAPSTTTIAYVLFFLSAAPGAAEDLSVNACAYGASTTRAGAALANGTKAITGGTTANVWIKAAFATPPSITEGEPYWIVIGNPTGAASGYSILSRGTCQTAIAGADLSLYSSADGFATNGTVVISPPPVVVSLTDGLFLGTSVTLGGTNDTNDTNERGIKFTPDVDTVLVGITHQGQVTPPATASIKVYADGQAPGGTVFAGFNGGAALACNDNAAALGVFKFTPCTLQGGTTYRVVYDYAANSQFPGSYAIEDYTHDEAALLAGAPPGVIHTIEAGGAWTDTPSKFPRMSLIIQKHVVEAAGSGGGPVVGGRLLRGVGA